MMQKRVLSLSTAKKIAEASEKKANELKITIVVSIVDEGGNLKFFLRMDGTSYGSIRISQIKAKTSASLPLSTRALAEKNAKAAGAPYGGGAIPELTILAGGLPILTQSVSLN